MYKEYDDGEAAGQTGEWLHLVYCSDKISGEGVEGKWFYLGYEDSGEYSGMWKLMEYDVVS